MIKLINKKMRYISSLCLLVCCIWLSGCQADENLRSANETGLLITLTDELDHAYARTIPSALEKPVADMFHLRVAYSGTDNVAYDDKCTESILLKEGTYDLTATYGENPVIALDAPYYIGKLESQEVVTGQMTSANISCTVGNALLSVIYNESALKKVYDTYFVTVSVGQESVNLDATSGKSAYFQAGSSVSLVFHGQLAGTGQEVSYDIPAQEKFANIPARTHVKVTLGVDESSVSSGVGISVEKLETETVSVVETLPSEFMPKPKLEAEGFVNNELSFAETEKKTAVIRLKLASPLQDLKLKFHSTDEKFAGLEAEKEYVLSNAEDKAAIEAALGIALPDIGATEGSLDFTSLIPQLMTDNGNTVSSTIEVDVEANNRWASEDETVNRVYTLKCNKPEFSISVDEKNCWSREFTIDEVSVMSGDIETIKNNLVYQYWDGIEWKNCMTREFVAGRTQQFSQTAEEISEKSYKVRALYRGAIASNEAEITLEMPEQLPNSGMDEWNVETYIKEGGWFSRDETYYSFNPWKNDEDHFWDTCNDFTTRHRNNSNANIYNYNGFHAVSYVTGRNGLAAELRSTANGRGNMVATFYDFNKVAGELFTGTAKVTMGTSGFFGDADGSKDTYEREKDASFYNRPTALKFWYKYVPYDSDTWKVHVELLDESRNVIIQNDYTSSEIKNDWTETTLPLNYVEGVSYAKCKYIYVIFSSTINSGSNMPYREITQTFYVNGETKTFSPAYVGSVLTIDDISLIYDK